MSTRRLPVLISLLAFSALLTSLPLAAEVATPPSVAAVVPIASATNDLPQPRRVFDVASMNVLLDGILFSPEEAKKLGLYDLEMAIDENEDFVRAFRTRDEADAYRATLGPGICSGNGSEIAADQCIFYQSMNCAGSAITISCGNVVNPPWLIRSFRKDGCARAFVCNSINCTEACNTVTAAGCYNVTSANARCGGCSN